MHIIRVKQPDGEIREYVFFAGALCPVEDVVDAQVREWENEYSRYVDLRIIDMTQRP